MDRKSSSARMKARIQLVEEHIRLENLHDLDGVLETFGEGARYHDEPWDDHRVGRDQVRLYYEQMLAAAPDLQIDIGRRYAAEEAVIVEVTISGTHQGPW